MVKRFGFGVNWSVKCLSFARFLLLVLLVVFSSSRVNGELPSYVPDEDLVRSPTIVIAKWEGSPLVSHDCIDNNRLITVMEFRTEIVVTRVIKGTLSLGKHTVLIRRSFGDMNGSEIVTGKAREGGAAGIRGEKLWFLESHRDWDESDRSIYPAMDSFRGVQPIALEPYYHALALPHRDEEVVKLLDSAEPIVVERTLRYLAGGMLPWPYETAKGVEGPQSVRTPLTGHAAKVEQLLDRKDPQIRRTAASVYTAMANQAALPVLRNLLNDGDAEVRAIAVGSLGRLHDRVSVNRFATAMRGNENHILICKVIDILAEWKSEEAVPTLVTFLENDGNAYRDDANPVVPIADHTLMPAVRARLALHSLTGLWFPQDVDASHRAWEQVKLIADRKERERQWKSLVPGVACPFKANLEGDRGKRQIVVTNITRQPVTIADHPSGIDHLASPYSILGTPNDRSATLKPGDSIRPRKPLTLADILALPCSMIRTPNDRFVTLKPGESIHFDATCYCDGCWPNSHSLLIGYWDTGRKEGVNAWVGAFEVSCKSIYKIPNGKVEKVVARWPDGNLRTTGEMRDGVKVGKWTDYDLSGKPIFTNDLDDHHEGWSVCELQIFDKDATEKAHEAAMSPIMPSE